MRLCDYIFSMFLKQKMPFELVHDREIYAIVVVVVVDASKSLYSLIFCLSCTVC